MRFSLGVSTILATCSYSIFPHYKFLYLSCFEKIGADGRTDGRGETRNAASYKGRMAINKPQLRFCRLRSDLPPPLSVIGPNRLCFVVVLFILICRPRPTT